MSKDSHIDVVILGAGLTGLTIAYHLNKAGKKVVIIDKNNHTGGVIQSHNEKGFTFESGPNTGVLSTPELVELFDELSPNCELEIANADAKKRLILKNGKWCTLPSGLKSAVSTPLFSFKDKIRVLGEPLRKKGINPDESVADLVKRRLGYSFLEYAIDPFISGIYAGDPNKLITRYALPKLYNLEQNYGSFIKGSAKIKKTKTERDKRATRDVFSAKGGLQKLTDALTNQIDSTNIFTGCLNIKVSKNDQGFNTSFENTTGNLNIDSAKVITTFGGSNLASTLSFIDSKDLQPIINLKYAKVVQVILGYNKWQGDKLDAFGGLIPSKEKRDILGILFPSSIFPNRAPQNGALLSIFAGGINKPELYDMPDEEIKRLVFNEVSSTLACTNQPDLIKIYRYKKAIPQYEITTGERYAAIEKIEHQHTGLILAGNIRDGIGMADRVKQAATIANQIIN